MSNDVLSKVFQDNFDRQGGVNKGCQYIAKRLKDKWTWKYLYHVYRGTVTPSKKLIRKLKRLAPPRPRRKRHRKIIEATSKEQLEQWNMFTADELRDKLDKK